MKKFDLSYFDQIVCLNIDKRYGERERIEREVGKQGGIVEFFLAGDGNRRPIEEYDQIDDPVVPATFNGFPNSYNAFKCFQRIIHRAYYAKIKNVLILEDDVEFTPNTSYILERALKQVQSVAAWDMLYLGANHSWSVTEAYDRNILKLNNSVCWHAVAIDERLFPKILDWVPLKPIDAMAASIQPYYNCYAVWPNIAIQRPGRSEVEQRDRDYSEFWSCPGNPCFEDYTTLDREIKP